MNKTLYLANSTQPKKLSAIPLTTYRVRIVSGLHSLSSALWKNILWIARAIDPLFCLHLTISFLVNGFSGPNNRPFTLQWRHYENDGVSNHQHHDCLVNRLFRRWSKKHESSASLAFVRGIHRLPANSLHKGPVTRSVFPFDDVIMQNAPFSMRTGLNNLGAEHQYDVNLTHTVIFFPKTP